MCTMRQCRNGIVAAMISRSHLFSSRPPAYHTVDRLVRFANKIEENGAETKSHCKRCNY